MFAIEHAPAGVDRMPEVRGVRARQWLASVLVLSLLLLALARWLGPGIYTIDENAYRTQVAQLVDEGTWAVPLIAAPGSMPTVEAPLALSHISGEVFFPYARHAAYPAVLAALDPVAPTDSALLLSGASLVLLALVAGIVTDRLPSVDGRIGFWVVASASPFLVHSQIGWAHLPAAAAFAVSFATLQRSDRWSPSRGLVVGAAIAVAVLFRTEALVACAGLFAVAALPGRSLSERSRWLATIGGSAAVAFVGDRLLFRWATGDVGLTPTGLAESPDGVVVQRLQAAVATFLDVGGVSPQHVARLLAAILVLLAAVLIRRRADLGMATALSALSIALGLYGALNGDSYPGLLAAWPLLGPAIVFTGAEPAHRRSLLLLVVTWVALVGVSPPDGGGLGWGGRLGLIVLAVAVPMVAESLVVARESDERAVQVVVGAAALLTVIVSVAGLRTLHVARETSVAVEAQVTAALEPLVGGDQVLVSTDRRLGRIAPGVALRLPLQSLPDDGELDEFLALAEAAGVDRVIHLDLFDNDDPAIPYQWRASEPRFDETVRTIVIERERP